MSGQKVTGGRRVPAELVVDNSASASASNTFLATYQGFVSPIVGLAVTGSAVDPAFGVTSVANGTGVSTQGDATILGIIIDADVPGGGVLVQYRDVVTLTEDEWAAVISGGLVQSEAFFIDTGGHMADVAPGTPGNWSSQVGVGLSTTQMLLCCPSVPVLVA